MGGGAIKTPKCPNPRQAKADPLDRKIANKIKLITINLFILNTSLILFSLNIIIF